MLKKYDIILLKKSMRTMKKGRGQRSNTTSENKGEKNDIKGKQHREIW